MVKDCPKCGLANPESAQRCDCGYDFAARSVERSYANLGNRAERGLTLAQVGVRNMVLGPLVCLAGIAVTLLTWSLSWATGVYVIAWGAVVGGIAQFFRGLRQHRRAQELDRA